MPRRVRDRRVVRAAVACARLRRRPRGRNHRRGDGRRAREVRCAGFETRRAVADRACRVHRVRGGANRVGPGRSTRRCPSRPRRRRAQRHRGDGGGGCGGHTDGGARGVWMYHASRSRIRLRWRTPRTVAQRRRERSAVRRDRWRTLSRVFPPSLEERWILDRPAYRPMRSVRGASRFPLAGGVGPPVDLRHAGHGRRLCRGAALRRRGLWRRRPGCDGPRRPGAVGDADLGPLGANVARRAVRSTRRACSRMSISSRPRAAPAPSSVRSPTACRNWRCCRRPRISRCPPRPRSPVGPRAGAGWRPDADAVEAVAPGFSGMMPFVRRRRGCATRSS